MFTDPKPKRSNDKYATWEHTNKLCQYAILSALANDLFIVYCSQKDTNDS